MLYLDKFFLDNLSSTPLLYTSIGKYKAQQSTTNKLENSNRVGMEHVSLSDITIGSEDLAIRRSDDTLINTNQVSAYIDIWEHGYWDFSFDSRKSGN